MSKLLISESFFTLVEQPNAGQGRLSLEILRSHTAHHSRQDFSGRVQPDNKEHSHDPVEIQTPNPSKRAAADSRFRLLDNWRILQLVKLAITQFSSDPFASSVLGLIIFLRTLFTNKINL